jgi:NifB/MoaA-like Fe-S oxidoreductase
VGLTRHRERLPQLRSVTDVEAAALVRTIEGWQTRFLADLGTRFVWAADELYLQARAPLPGARAYEGFAIAEDGIGLARRFTDGWPRAVRRAPLRLAAPRTVTVVTGQMFAPSLAAMLTTLQVEQLAVRLAPIANDWFGRGIGVAGLVTGHDIEAQLAGRDVGDAVLVPAVALRDGAGVFLDDLTPADLGASLGAPVVPVEPTPAALVSALVGAR